MCRNQSRTAMQTTLLATGTQVGVPKRCRAFNSAVTRLMTP